MSLPTPEEITEYRKKTGFKPPSYEDFEKLMGEAKTEEKPEKFTKKEARKVANATQIKFFNKYMGDPHIHTTACNHAHDFPFKTTEEIAKETFEGFMQEPLPPISQEEGKPKKKVRHHIMEAGSQLSMREALATQMPGTVAHTFKTLTSNLLPHEKGWLADLKAQKERVQNEDILFMLDFFTTEDLRKLVKGQALGKVRLAQIQQEVNKETL